MTLSKVPAFSDDFINARAIAKTCNIKNFMLMSKHFKKFALFQLTNLK